MSVPRRWRCTTTGISLLVVLLVASLLGAMPSAAARGVGAPADHGCGGTPVRTAYSGTLTVEGGSLPVQSVDGVTVDFSFDYQTELIDRSTGAVLSVTCTSTTADARTNATGGFSLALHLPPVSCSAETDTCDVASGPFAPFDVTLATAAPVGYSVATRIAGDSVTIAYVADLAQVTLTPPGPVVGFSPTADETLRAQPEMGNGSASPGSPTYAWTVVGSGWRFVSASTGPEVNLTAVAGAGPGTVTVVARLAVGNTTLTAGPTNLTVEAVPTTVLAASENRSEVDAGGSIAVAIEATGAPGYAYSAALLPGLGLSSLPLACSSAVDGSTAEALACTGNATYPSAGTASPEVIVSNGYSTATADLGAISVSAAPALEVLPTDARAYAGEPTAVRLTAVAGTAPYREACLAPGEGAPLCDAGPGPAWTMEPVYAGPGNFSATAWAVDADGNNATLAFDVEVAAPVSLSAVQGSSVAAAGVVTELSANLSGGFFPARYWWNVSGTPGSVATGVASSDGPLTALWVPAVPGAVAASLTVVDALGTAVERSSVIPVGADPALSVASVVLPPSGPVMAGSPVGLAWEALDGAGSAVVGYAAGVTLSVVGPSGADAAPTWVNVSGIGPVAPAEPGVFPVPSDAWSLGRLALSISTSAAGLWSVGLSGLGSIAAPSPVAVDVGADLAALHLYDPVVVLPGERENHTFWHLADRFGNPAVGSSVDVAFSSVGYSTVTAAPVVAAANGTSGVWVNFTAPSAAGGTVEVTSALSGVLLALAVPAAPAPGPELSPGLVLVLVAAGAAAGAVTWAYRSSRRRSGGEGPPPDEELRRFVEGRDRVIALVGRAGAADLPTIEAGWPGAAPAGLSDWVASLVADGTLGARTGPDGVARFCLAGPRQGPPHVILDPAALEAATRAREELARETGDPSDGGEN